MIGATRGPRHAIRFIRRWNNYFNGDVITCPARMAQGLVDGGFAEKVNISRETLPPEGGELAMRPPGEPPRRRSVHDEEGM